MDKKKLEINKEDAEGSLAELKDMKTVIFFSTSAESHVKSLECLNNACNADERCEHRIFFRPIMDNFYQWIGGHKVEPLGHVILGHHEILYVPVVNEELIERLRNTKNIVLEINCMCFVGENDKKKHKVKKIIDWLLEETEEIEL